MFDPKKDYDQQDIREKIRSIHAQHKATLKGVELMQWNLYWRLHHWVITFEDREHRPLTVSELCFKIEEKAPKTIMQYKPYFVKAFNDLWSVIHDYSINTEPWLLEDFEEYLNLTYGS